MFTKNANGRDLATAIQALVDLDRAGTPLPDPLESLLGVSSGLFIENVEVVIDDYTKTQPRLIQSRQEA